MGRRGRGNRGVRFVTKCCLPPPCPALFCIFSIDAVNPAIRAESFDLIGTIVG
jgi:hypothetical protein